MEDTSKGLEDIFNIIGEGTSNVGLPVSCYVQFCTVSKRYDINNIYGDGSTNESIGNSASVSDTIKQCEAVSVSGGLKFLCPTEANETITEKCSCDNKDQLITNLSEVLVGFAMAEELKKYLDCDNATQDNETK